MIVKMIQNLKQRKKMQESINTFNKDLKEIKNKQIQTNKYRQNQTNTEKKNTITETKNTLERINRSSEGERHVSDLENRMVEITAD